MSTTMQKRTETVQCRLTPQQKQALDKLAEHEGLSRSDFVLLALSEYILQVCQQREADALQHADDPEDHKPRSHSFRP